VAISLILLAVGATEPARTVRSLVGGVLEPARAAIEAGAVTVVDAVVGIGEIGSLREDNEALRTELAAAEQRIAELSEAVRENEELRGLLRVTRALDMELLPARVTAREPSGLVAECLVDAGARDGVEPGMPVLADAGGAGALVGTVVEVTDDSARVRFIVDARSVVIAVDQETRALGELRGQAGGQLVLVNVPLTEPLATDDTVVTAGITVGDDSSRYPAGLLVGRIQAIETDPNALTQTAYVRPALDHRELERLLIVLDATQG
jgi:rod shape-determining protein MreC